MFYNNLQDNRTTRVTNEGKVSPAVVQPDVSLYVIWTRDDLQKLIWTSNVPQKPIGLEFEHLRRDTNLAFMRQKAKASVTDHKCCCNSAMNFISCMFPLMIIGKYLSRVGNRYL